jgi:hypothetical protein
MLVQTLQSMLCAIEYTRTCVYTLCAEKGKKVVLLVLALRKINDKASLQYVN